MVSLLLGVLAAIYRDGWPDKVVPVLSVAALATPSFWLAVLLIQSVTLALGLLPAAGPLPDPLADPGGYLARMALPAIALAVPVIGQLTRAHHVAGEIGHVPVPGAELLRCPCGRYGHLEALGAGPAIHRRYLALGGDAASPDTRDVVARADAGELLAVQVVTDAATAVGRAVAGVASVLDPQVVVVGGGMAGAGDLWWDALEGALRREVVDALADLPVRRAALGTGAPVVGAARGAWRLLGGGEAVPDDEEAR